MCGTANAGTAALPAVPVTVQTIWRLIKLLIFVLDVDCHVLVDRLECIEKIRSTSRHHGRRINQAAKINGAMPFRPTMADVAAAARVSKALVSIVLRGAPGASEATRGRVFHGAERLGYRTNRTASLLKLRHTRHLGITMNVRNAFAAELVEGIHEAADREGLSDRPQHNDGW
jgi:hypothetical protein